MVFGRGKKNGSTPSLAQFRDLGKAFMGDPEAREQLKVALIGMNGGVTPAPGDDMKKLAGRLVVQAKAQGVRKLPNRMALTMLLEDLFGEDGDDDSPVPGGPEDSQ